jgi:hypothetical protein
LRADQLSWLNLFLRPQPTISVKLKLPCCCAAAATRGAVVVHRKVADALQQIIVPSLCILGWEQPQSVIGNWNATDGRVIAWNRGQAETKAG